MKYIDLLSESGMIRGSLAKVTEVTVVVAGGKCLKVNGFGGRMDRGETTPLNGIAVVEGKGLFVIFAVVEVVAVAVEVVVGEFVVVVVAGVVVVVRGGVVVVAVVVGTVAVVAGIVVVAVVVVAGFVVKWSSGIV